MSLHVKWTASEMAALWTTYQHKTMTLCLLSHMLQHAEDTEIQPVLQNAYHITKGRVEQIRTLFHSEQFPMPVAFSEEHDVNPEAPALFTDLFALSFVLKIAKIGMVQISTQNALGMFFAAALSQVASSANIRNHLETGKDISKKHMQALREMLIADDIQAPMSPDHSVTTSTSSSFSDRMMMFTMSFLSALGIGNYALASSMSQRSDVIALYNRLAVDVARYAKDGVDLFIQNGWFEEPPAAPDHRDIAKQ